MTPKSVELLRLEAIRLIKLQIEKLNQLTQIPNLLIADSKDAQSYDPDKVRNAISILEGELSKLEELDMVLAVVGTMKAGKSTTNNAIVGLEVLPNRSTPMTALPTRIRHVPGQPEPRMNLPNVEPLNRVLHALATQLARPEQYEKIEHEEQDLKSLADRIKVGMSFATEYQGQENIFTFLKELNDLVRLCQKLECEFPYADYQNIADLPMIEVAFCHLNEQASNQGHFTLLDTPGPNEMGMGVLKKMMREQLQRASAVMVVMDATQLKSESDHDVRSELLAIADVAEDRLYVLVNKFDQMDRSFNKEQIQRLISRDLLMGKVPESHVFPVSAKFAYLANRAQHALTHQGALPDHQQHDWVADFAEAALHPHRWQNEINDIDEVKQGISYLWDKSCFDAPLTEVIKKAHAKASLLALASSAAKMVEQSERMNNFVEIRDNALNSDIATLESDINRIDQDVKKIEACRDNALNKSSGLLKYLEAYSTECNLHVNSSLNKVIEELFGKWLKQQKENENNKVRFKPAIMQEKKDNENSLYKLAKKSVKKFFGTNRNPEPRDWDEIKEKYYKGDQTVIVEKNKDDAKKLLNSIGHALENETKQISEEISNAINGLKDELKTQSEQVRNEAQQIIDSINQGFMKKGVVVNLSLPEIHPIPSIFSGQLILEDMFEETKIKEKRGFYRSSVWGWLCELFDTDEWGRDSYIHEETVYHIDMTKVANEANDNIKNIFSKLNCHIKKEISEPINSSIEKFFDDFMVAVDEIRGDLIQGKKQSQLNQEQKMVLAKQLENIKRDLPVIRLDSKELKLDLAKDESPVNTSLKVTTEGYC
ncbi:TPA: dynamin family protein [Aeromonas veronii]